MLADGANLENSRMLAEQMREAIAGLPDGIYDGEDFLDDDGPDHVHGGPS